MGGRCYCFLRLHPQLPPLRTSQVSINVPARSVARRGSDQLRHAEMTTPLPRISGGIIPHLKRITPVCYSGSFGVDSPLQLACGYLAAFLAADSSWWWRSDGKRAGQGCACHHTRSPLS
jgi:hypothetical protein